MAYLGRTSERYMYYGAKEQMFELARELRKSMTEAERVLWSRLRNRQIDGLIFRRQHPVDVYIVDFYCHKHKLVIEVDGEIHDIPENAEKDKGRTVEMERFGLKVIRFSNDDVLRNVEIVIDKIKLQLSDKGVENI